MFSFSLIVPLFAAHVSNTYASVLKSIRNNHQVEKTGAGQTQGELSDEFFNFRERTISSRKQHMEILMLPEKVCPSKIILWHYLVEKVSLNIIISRQEVFLLYLNLIIINYQSIGSTWRMSIFLWNHACFWQILSLTLLEEAGVRCGKQAPRTHPELWQFRASYYFVCVHWKLIFCFCI